MSSSSTPGPDASPKNGHSHDEPDITQKVKRLVFGGPKDLADRSIFHHISLIPFLAWIGLGADGLSSSAYGPEETFKSLGSHTYLAVALALATGTTVIVISLAYSRIIEQFPYGGGGYVVATKLLGKPAGVISGCALLVDYILTITVSVAAAGEALFSLDHFPLDASYKFPVEIGFIIILSMLNIRGVRESVMALTPIFIVFVITHLVLIGGSVACKLPELAETARGVETGFREQGLGILGVMGMLKLIVHAYSMGGGTYTGIEAVSNGLPILREPHVKNGKKTMLYMACSLAFTAAGLLVSYLLWHVTPVDGKTMNAVLVDRFASGFPGGWVFITLTLVSESALLVVAAQAGFIDGPRVLANMAVDSWMPRRFAALSERLTTQNGVILMGALSLGALFYTRGKVDELVTMYSINVFLTFSCSMFAMARFWFRERGSGLAG